MSLVQSFEALKNKYIQHYQYYLEYANGDSERIYGIVEECEVVLQEIFGLNPYEIAQLQAGGHFVNNQIMPAKNVTWQPYQYEGTNGNTRPYCPRCFVEHGQYQFLYNNPRYCSECGQKVSDK